MASCGAERASKKSKPHKRNDLTLALKYEVVKTAEREKLGVRKLSENVRMWKDTDKCDS